MRILELVIALVGIVLVVLGVINLAGDALGWGILEILVGLVLLVWAEHRHPTARL